MREFKVKMDKEIRTANILKTAIFIAETYGIEAVTRKSIANLENCTIGLLNHYYHGGIKEIKAKMLDEAVRSENLSIIAQCISSKNLTYSRLPQELRRRAAMFVIGH